MSPRNGVESYNTGFRDPRRDKTPLLRIDHNILLSDAAGEYLISRRYKPCMDPLLSPFLCKIDSNMTLPQKDHTVGFSTE